MTLGQYAKIKAVAEDERADPATRAIAQRQVAKWAIIMGGLPVKKLHPGRVQSEEYKRWAKDMTASGNHDLKR